MLTGVAAYFIYTAIPQLDETHEFVSEAIAYIQPMLIFCMLFLTFCKIDPKSLRLTKWHLWLIMIQVCTFVLLGLPLIFCPENQYRVVLEGAMICMITPTATAAAVITGKLGGNAQTLVSYTMLANLTSAIVIPIVVPMVHPSEGVSFLPAFIAILRKVFPLLIFPLFLAWLVRIFMPKLHAMMQKPKNLAFYMWAVSLSLAIAVTTRSIVHSNEDLIMEVGIAVAALITCAIQFALGKMIGGKYNDRISGGQALGQKNTVFTIWLGATFLTPVTSIAGGFYSVCHNVVNSYQLYKVRKTAEKSQEQEKA